jgi:hypothetical protein
LIPGGAGKGFETNGNAKIFESFPFFNEGETKNVGDG